MGFDINIEMVLFMCPETGKPYHYGKGLEHVYEIPTLNPPKELIRYFRERGHVFHAYTEFFNQEEKYNVYVEQFLEEYPCWDDVKEHSCYDDYWTEKDHNNFKKLLEWCLEQPVTFRITWSY